MRLVNISCLIGLSVLAQFTLAVFLEDAFVRDWSKSWIGQISSFEFQDSSTIVGLSDQNQLFGAQAVGSSQNISEILWRADLSQFGENQQFLLNKQLKKVYTYSRGDNKVYSWDSQTGLLDSVYTVKSAPLSVVNFFNRGILSVGSDGSVELLPENLSIQPQLEIYKISPAPSNVGIVRASQHDGVIYIAVPDKKIIGISGTGSDNAVTAISYDTDAIVELKDNLIVTQNKDVKIIEGSKVNSVKSLSLSVQDQVVLINSKYFLTYKANEQEYKVYSIDDRNKATVVEGLPEVYSPIVSVSYVTASINDFLVISTSEDKVVIDITGLLSDDDPSSVPSTKFEHPSKSESGIVDFIAYDEKDSFQLISSSRVFGLDIDIIKHDAFGVETSVLRSNDYFHSQSSKYLAVNKPISDETAIDSAHHILQDEQVSGFSLHDLFILRWWRRVNRHIIELIEYSFFALANGKLKNSSSSSDITEEQFGLKKLIVFLDELRESLVAVNSLDGSIEWATSVKGGKFIDIVQVTDEKLLLVFENEVFVISLRNGHVLGSYGVDGLIERVFVVDTETTDEDQASADVEDEDKLIAAVVQDSSAVVFLGSSGRNEKVHFSDDKYFIDKRTGNGFKFTKDTFELIETWRLPNSDEVVQVSKPSSRVPSGNGIGIVLADKSVLYKYLYPNIAAVLTYREDKLTFYIVDIVTGSQLYVQSHEQESILEDSILITMDNNWIIYSYFATNPRAEQRIVVVDLFETGTPNEKSNEVAHAQDSLSAFSSYNKTIGEVSTKSFIFPERILKLSHSVTKFGITTRNILAFTDSGSLVQIPKYILNSRRIADREFTQADAMNDFRLSPYEAVITSADKYNVINHKKQLSSQVPGEILTVATELESTSVVCYLNNLDWFCTTIHPSLQYDTLGKNFAKTKLLITMLLLLLGVVISKPIIASKRLNAIWLDGVRS